MQCEDVLGMWKIVVLLRIKAENEPQSQPLPVTISPPALSLSYLVWQRCQQCGLLQLPGVLEGNCVHSVPICLTLPRRLDLKRHNCKSKASLAGISPLHKAKEDDKRVFYLPQLLSRLFPPWGRIRNNLHHIVYQPGFLLQHETVHLEGQK